jgi:hypothetical protein
LSAFGIITPTNPDCIVLPAGDTPWDQNEIANMKIFLDTEFTDLLDPQLISIGMVAETGEEFYAEVPYPDEACTAFVREAVIPLLGRVPGANCALSDLRSLILTWLSLVRRRNEDLEICIDYQTDWDLFSDALDYRIPAWCQRRMVAREINELLRYEYHKKNGYEEHHALYDAKANQYAFRERPDG